jgi:3-hydroxyacyl-CoA dehydrogenase
MSKPIRRVAVLGAGVMGSGIAAHCANAGLPVLLLDIVPPNLDDEQKKSRAARNSFADGALKKMLKAKPAAFFHPKNAQLITTGNFDDDLDKLADYDLVVEAIIERLDIKRGLFEKLENIIDDDTLIASNTSGLRIEDMLEGRKESFKKNFLVTHFFNPPRYMKLLELVAGPDTDPAAIEKCEGWGKEMLGKGIVHAKDTPNFVANRIGAHAMMAAIHLMLEHDIAPEDLDQITGVPMGHPKSATFRTGDMVGIDTLVHVVDNCYKVLTDDEDRETFKLPDYIRQMIEKKQLGNKTKGGFYKKTKEGIMTLDPKTGDYRERGGDEAIRKTCKGLAKIEDVRERVAKLVDTDGVVGEVAWKATAKSLAYSARRIGEICDDVVAIDNGMKWGYNWELGPFEIWDAIGFEKAYDRMVADGYELPESVKKMKESGAKAFYDGDKVYDLLKGDYVSRDKDPREVTVEILRRGEAPVLSNNGAEAWDLGDGVLGVTFKTKANSIDADIIAMLNDSVDRAERDFRAMLITNKGDHFCVGANLFAVVMAAQQKQWDGLREMVGNLHKAVQRMRYSTIPVVAAPYGMALGGGLEICMASNAVQAAAETYAGLVEVGVGLVPGGGGNKNMLWQAFEAIPDGVEVDSYAVVTQVFKNIAMADVATSAVMAQRKGYFNQQMSLSFDRARQLHEAKQKAIGMAESGFHPPIPRAYKLPGESGIATLQMLVNTLINGGYATEHDGVIAMKLAEVLCGGKGGAAREVTEDEVLELEREAFVSLCGEPKSQERMQHMLMKNKPLRN